MIMKILVVATSIVPGNSLGIEHFTYRIIAALSTYYPDSKIIVLIPGNSQVAWGERLPKNVNIQFEQMRFSPTAFTFAVHGMRNGNRFLSYIKGLQIARCIYASLKKLELIGLIKKHRPDIVYSPFHIENLVFGHGKVVLSVHDLREVTNEFFDEEKARTLTSNIKNSSAIAIAWLHPFEQFNRLFPEESEKAFLIPFPIPISSPAHGFQQQTNSEKEILLFASALRPQKNHVNIIRAMPDIIEARHKVGKQVLLICAGTKHSPLYESLVEEVEKLGIQKHVSFTGFISDSKLQTLYAQSTMIVSPTLWEAASGSVFEAFSFGKPAACSNIPPIVSQVEQSGALVRFFDPYDPLDIARAVLDVLENPAQYISGSQSGSVFLSSLSWELTARQYMDLFRRIAKS